MVMVAPIRYGNHLLDEEVPRTDTVSVASVVGGTVRPNTLRSTPDVGSS